MFCIIRLHLQYVVQGTLHGPGDIHLLEAPSFSCLFHGVQAILFFSLYMIVRIVFLSELMNDVMMWTASKWLWQLYGENKLHFDETMTMSTFVEQHT